MYRIPLLIISGILCILFGMVAIPLLFVYSMTQSPDLDILFYFFPVLIIFGMALLIMAGIQKKKKQL